METNVPSINILDMDETPGLSREEHVSTGTGRSKPIKHGSTHTSMRSDHIAVKEGGHAAVLPHQWTGFMLKCGTFIVDLSVPIDVSFPDHLIHLLVGQLLAEVGHHMTQLRGADVAVAVLGGGGDNGVTHTDPLHIIPFKR